MRLVLRGTAIKTNTLAYRLALSSQLVKVGIWPPLLEGLNYVRQDRALWSLMLLSAALNLAIAGPLIIGLAVMAQQRFSSATDFGLMLSFLAIASLVGSLLPALTKKQR